MKKIIALALTLVLVLSMSVTVFATGSTSGESGKVVYDTTKDPVVGPTDTNGKVTISMNSTDENVAEVYYVVVAWNDLTFTYDFGDAKLTWNPLTHEYAVDGTTKGWSKKVETDALTVANHSNATVKVDATVDGKKQGITVDLIEKTGAVDNILDSADVVSRISNYAAADRLVYNIQVSGTPVSKDTTVFALTVKISH